jgi:hypothetical protein
MPPRGQAGQAPFGARRLHSFPPSGFQAPVPVRQSRTFSHERRLNMRRRPRRSLDTIPVRLASQAFAKRALPRPLRLHGTECHRRREDGSALRTTAPSSRNARRAVPCPRRAVRLQICSRQETAGVVRRLMFRFRPAHACAPNPFAAAIASRHQGNPLTSKTHPIRLTPPST